MDPLGSVHILSNVIIHGQTGQHEGLIAIQVGKARDNEVNGFPHGDLHGFIQIFV